MKRKLYHSRLADIFRLFFFLEIRGYCFVEDDDAYKHDGHSYSIFDWRGPIIIVFIICLGLFGFFFNFCLNFLYFDFRVFLLVLHSNCLYFWLFFMSHLWFSWLFSKLRILPLFNSLESLPHSLQRIKSSNFSSQCPIRAVNPHIRIGWDACLSRAKIIVKWAINWIKLESPILLLL